VFNAIAEPRRRQIIEVLAASEERDVTELVHTLRLPQPAVSKHLRVLRSVRLVTVSRRGRRRVYRLNPRELKTVHDWAKHFERFWSQQISRIKARAEARAREQQHEPSEKARQPKEQS
jgi:DNA-binding transcriptional ArsR family regulator